MALCRPRPLDHFSVLSACGNLKFAVAQTRRARSYGTWWALAANGESSRDQAARNQAVKQKLMELEKLRSSIASKKGVSDVEAAEEVARRAVDSAAKAKEAAELNRKLEEMMELKRKENAERQTRAQAKRGIQGIRAVANMHTQKHRRAAEIRRNTETIDAVLGLRRGTASAFNDAASMWQKLPEELTSAFTFSKVLGRGSFGVVVLAEKKQDGMDSMWSENCDITGKKLQCDDGSTKVSDRYEYFDCY